MKVMGTFMIPDLVLDCFAFVESCTALDPCLCWLVITPFDWAWSQTLLCCSDSSHLFAQNVHAWFIRLKAALPLSDIYFWCIRYGPSMWSELHSHSFTFLWVYDPLLAWCMRRLCILLMQSGFKVHPVAASLLRLGSHWVFTQCWMYRCLWSNEGLLTLTWLSLAAIFMMVDW